MIDFDDLGLEANLNADYAQIDAFYEKELKLHRIHVRDNLFLSALELPANSKDSEGTTLEDSSNTLVILPGRAETEHKYAELLYHLRNTNLRVIVCFVRGQGQSSTVLYGENKCHVDKFSHYRADLKSILSYLDVGPNYRLLAFSLGGLLGLDFHFNSQFPHKPKAIALITPFLGIRSKIPTNLLHSVLSVLCNIRSFAIGYTPYSKQYQRIPFAKNFHSHSEVRYHIYHDYYASHPHLAQSGPTWKFVNCCLGTQLNLLNHPEKCEFKTPTICFIAGSDQVVNSDTALQFCKAHENDPMPIEYELIPHAYHDILNESDSYRNPYLKRALEFLFKN